MLATALIRIQAYVMERESKEHALLQRREERGLLPQVTDCTPFL